MAHILMKQTNYNYLPKMTLVGQRMVFSKGNMGSYMDNLSFFLETHTYWNNPKRKAPPSILGRREHIIFE